MSAYWAVDDKHAIVACEDADMFPPRPLQHVQAIAEIGGGDRNRLGLLAEIEVCVVGKGRGAERPGQAPAGWMRILMSLS